MRIGGVNVKITNDPYPEIRAAWLRWMSGEITSDEFRNIQGDCSKEDWERRIVRVAWPA